MRLFNSIRIALLNVKARLFHTFLSILGIVIGVAALVCTLCLIDGMEKYARDQLADTTSIQDVNIMSQPYKRVNGLRIKKENYAYLTYPKFQELVNSLGEVSKTLIESSRVKEIKMLYKGDTLNLAAEIVGRGQTGDTGIDSSMIHGRFLNASDLSEAKKVCVINAKLAQAIAKDTDPASLLGSSFQTPYGELEIIGVGKKLRERSSPQLLSPISLLPNEELRLHPANCTIVASDVHQVAATKEKISNWLKTQFKDGHEDFRIFTNEARLKQAETSFLVFRVIMSMIVGLSVLVGGIGIMNVMLISVNERTTEIGISKAMGAKRKDIFIQFLSESVTISGLGSILGLVLGVLATFGFVPIIKSMTKMPFQADYTLNTLIVIGLVALAVGVLFGTYPAMRASRLNPVEAMRRE